MNYSIWMFVLFLVLSGKLTVTWDTGTPIHCSHLKNPSIKAVNHRFYARDSYPKSYQKKCISLLTSSDVIQQSYWCPGLIFICKEMLKSHILLENGEDISPKSPLAMQNRFQYILSQNQPYYFFYPISSCRLASLGVQSGKNLQQQRIC